jgi:hypothetical protein
LVRNASIGTAALAFRDDGLDGLHEGVRDANGVVRVLARNSQIGLALPVGVVLINLNALPALLRQLQDAGDVVLGDETRPRFENRKTFRRKLKRGRPAKNAPQQHWLK